ncbi:MAG: IMPACT family protein [Propionibacteriaceae bacterium]|nr:IMPACT family protein [Propionibacteriaceae bacterium]
MEFSTPAAPAASRVEVKKSVFLGLVAPVDSVEEADAVLAAVRKQHYSARHHCTALVLDQLQRSNDDGEPSGSAGAPMLSVLRHRQVNRVFAVVTRYFGGTLLGVGGLIRAYTQAVAEALDAAVLVRRVPMAEYVATAGLARAGAFENALRSWAASNQASVEAEYGASARFAVELPAGLAGEFEAAMAPWAGRGVVVAKAE